MMKREFGQSPFSMGNRAFRHQGAVVRENGRDYLELYPCEMWEKSRLTGKILTGWVSSLKYQHDGNLYYAEGGAEDQKYLRLPLEVFKMHFCPGGEVKGMLPIIVNCSVGNAHMPESTAILMFWM